MRSATMSARGMLAGMSSAVGVPAPPIDLPGDAAIAIITFSAPDQVAVYQRALLAPLPVLVHETRATYAAYGLGRGPVWKVWKVWGPKIWLAYAKLVRGGRRRCSGGRAAKGTHSCGFGR